MMKDKISSIYLVVAFAVIITLPMICFEHKEDAVSYVQAKTLAAKPAVYAEGKWNADFWEEFQQYVGDRIGFRDDAVAAVLVLKYYFFGVLDIPDFSMGSNQNIYYSNQFDQIDVYDGKSKYTMDEMSEMAQNVEGMQQALSKLDTDLYCVYIPNKEGVYWEDFYGGKIAIHAESSRMDDFCDFLEKNTQVKAMNLKNIFHEYKDQMMLYYKVYDGSHWNQNGAFYGTQAILQKIRKDYPEINGIIPNDYTKKEIDFLGCMERYKDVPLIHDHFIFEDTIVSYEPANGWVSKTNTGDIIEKGEVHLHNEQVKNNQSILILGDSYMGSFCLNYFGEQFRDVYFMSYGSDPADVLLLCERTGCKMVLFEVVERCFSKELYTYTISGYQQAMSD